MLWVPTYTLSLNKNTTQREQQKRVCDLEENIKAAKKSRVANGDDPPAPTEAGTDAEGAAALEGAADQLADGDGQGKRRGGGRGGRGRGRGGGQPKDLPKPLTAAQTARLHKGLDKFGTALFQFEAVMVEACADADGIPKRLMDNAKECKKNAAAVQAGLDELKAAGQGAASAVASVFKNADSWIKTAKELKVRLAAALAEYADDAQGEDDA
eukprot:2631578-Pyramimonas_sp.AAC.1